MRTLNGQLVSYPEWVMFLTSLGRITVSSFLGVGPPFDICLWFASSGANHFSLVGDVVVWLYYTTTDTHTHTNVWVRCTEGEAYCL